MSRNVQQCRHRDRLVGMSNDAPSHYCRLLKTLSGTDSPEWCSVSDELCRHCCRFTMPEADRLNPVIASRLYELSAQILGVGGVSGCDRQRAEVLVRKAEQEVYAEPAARDPSRETTAGGLSGFRSGAARRGRGRRIATWSVGITTSPRREPTLARCLASLLHAGWQSPRLFVDGPLALPESCRKLPVTQRDHPAGAWPNFYLSLSELAMRDPAADAYLMVQDDTLMCECPELRSYLERVLWPGVSDGVASLYCSRAYTQSRPGWYRFRGTWRWGANAFIFSRRAAQQFLADRYVVKHRWRIGRGGRLNVDGVIGRWCHRQRIPLYYPTPSLAQHIGESSTLWKNGQAAGDRQADWFASGAGDLP